MGVVMSIVLYPEDLAILCREYDATCEDLARRGANFSRENLAKQMLETLGLPFTLNPDVTLAPSSTAYH
jgi:hypothetical protein